LGGNIPGTVDSLQGKLLIDGLAMLVVSVSGNIITAQVPWEVRTGSRSFQINLPSSSAFYQTGNGNVIPAYFHFESADTRPNLFGVKIFTADFSALAANPIPAGAILHAYATGMGPVNGSPSTGVASDPGALIPIQATLTCQFAPQKSAAQTLFAGLAPELIGIYQIDFQLPDEGVAENLTGVTCRLVGPGFSVLVSANGPPTPGP
jgi:uncharacterized protein (TIGR03437 family)